MIIILVDGCKRAGQDQNLERHYDPDRVKAEHKHLCPVRAFDKIHGAPAEPVDQEIYQPIRISRLFKQDHKYQSNGQRIGHIGQKIDGLEQASQRRNGI